MSEKHGDSTSWVQNQTKINSLIWISFKAWHFDVFPLNHNAMTDLIYSHIYVPLRKNIRLTKQHFFQNRNDQQGRQNFFKTEMISKGALDVGQGLLNQMDRTLRALAKFESSNPCLILGTQITPRGWIFWTKFFYHQKIQVKIYLMRGQT